MLPTLFWLFLAVVFYTYLGYGLIVWLWARLRPLKRPALPRAFTPPVTLIVPAYNEADILEAKLANCLQQDYPAERLQVLVITDGSTDHSARVLARYPQVRHL
ncbi:glycosyltransferase, partial [Hymenobacter rigui]